MKNVKPYRRRAAVLIALVTIIFQMNLQSATGARTVAGGVADADLSAEDRILDGFVNDLGKFDKKNFELSRKATLTRLEFDNHQRDAESLKSRVSGVQNALREVIRKLKAAGQWDNLDQILLAKINDPAFQNLVRREGFKRALENAASNLSGGASDISKPLDLLRRKIQARASETVFEPRNSALASRSVRVAFQPEPAVFADSLRCRAASIRFGIAGFVYGANPKTNKARVAYNCACEGQECDAQ